MSALPSSPSSSAGPITVWDLPVRVFHWLLVFSFAGAYLTAESERWRLVHVSLGYTLAGLLAFRVIWGLVGTRHARFSQFVRGPAAAMRYLLSLLGPRPEHHVGHNPAGALAIIGLLGLGALTAFSGWAAYNEWGPEWLEEVHETVANGMLLLVGVHVLGVVVGSLKHRENLVRSMFTGRKSGPLDQGIRRTWRPLGALLLAAVLGFWAWQWQNPPVGADGTPGVSARGHDNDDDDD